MLANEVLGKDHFETRAIVETGLVPPLSCFITVVQITTTACTMGKGTNELRRGSSLSVMFTKKRKRLGLCLKDNVLESLRRDSSRDGSERIALTFVNRPILELSDVEKQRRSAGTRGIVFTHVIAAICGIVAVNWTRLLNLGEKIVWQMAKLYYETTDILSSS